MKSRLTIQERLKDLRKEKDINLEKLEELTGISTVSYTHLTLPTKA